MPLIIKLLKSLQIIGIDQIHAIREQFLPENGLVERAPKADAPALLMRGRNDGPQFLPLFIRHGVLAAPFELGRPILADPWNEVGRRIRLQIGKLAIACRVANRVIGQGGTGIASGEDGGDCVGFLFAVAKNGQDVRIFFQDLAEGGVSGFAFGFEIDEESAFRTIAIDMAAIEFHALAERFQV